jgi:hypothetical protein
MEPVWAWIKHSSLSQLVVGVPWIWPACETLHFIGMAMLIGVIGVIDLRMLGFMKRLPFAPLHRLLPWGIAGFIINLITGALFFTGDPYQYKDNIAFILKLAFILVAGINVLIFYRAPYRQVEAMGPGDDAPTSAKVIAATSILLWFGVMYWGRMLPFIGNAF